MVVSRSLLEVRWWFSFQHKPFFCQLLLFAVALRRSLQLHCHLHYECPHASWIIFILEITNLGQLWLHSRQPTVLILFFKTGFLFLTQSDRRYNQKPRGQSTSRIWLPLDKHLVMPVRGMGNSDTGLFSERDGWQHSTGQAAPFSLTSFKLWINLLIYWRKQDGYQLHLRFSKTLKRTN